MKGETVTQLELLLRTHPEGMRKAEIARRLGVHRSTVSRYVRDLSGTLGIYEENNLVKIKAEGAGKSVDLSLYESMAMNMAVEAVVDQNEFQDAHLSSALRKIALSLRSYAPRQADVMQNLADRIDKKVQSQKSGLFNDVLEVLIDSWVSGRIVKIIQDDGTETELAPYFIGFRQDASNHRSPFSVTGRLRHTRQIVTVDISTIHSAAILDETYTIPDNLKPFRDPDKPMGLQATDMVDLELKVKESSALNVFLDLQHGPMKKTAGEDGSTLIRVPVENSIELMKNIFQCGDSVEIIGPAWFRKKYLAYLAQILKSYR